MDGNFLHLKCKVWSLVQYAVSVRKNTVCGCHGSMANRYELERELGERAVYLDGAVDEARSPGLQARLHAPPLSD